MNKQEIYELLKRNKIWFEVTEHMAALNMDDLSRIDIPYPDAVAKNLFVRDDKKQNYYLITIKGDKRINLKEFRKNNHTRPLSFASQEDLNNILGLIVGAVTPLGMLNDQEAKVKFFLDRYFIEASEIIGVHPNENTATVWMHPEDLVKIIGEHGNDVEVVEM